MRYSRLMMNLFEKYTSFFVMSNVSLLKTTILCLHIITYTLHVFVCWPCRLWDTTWGNRDTLRDGSIDMTREMLMQSYVFRFMICLIIANVMLTSFLVLVLSNSAQLIFMVVLFTPTIVQILGSIFFLLIVVPLRGLTMRQAAAVKEAPVAMARDDKANMNRKVMKKSVEGGIRF